MIQVWIAVGHVKFRAFRTGGGGGCCSKISRRSWFSSTNVGRSKLNMKSWNLKIKLKKGILLDSKESATLWLVNGLQQLTLARGRCLQPPNTFQAIELSLKELGVDYLDLCLIHVPNSFVVWDTSWWKGQEVLRKSIETKQPSAQREEMQGYAKRVGSLSTCF